MIGSGNGWRNGWVIGSGMVGKWFCIGLGNSWENGLGIGSGNGTGIDSELGWEMIQGTVRGLVQKTVQEMVQDMVRGLVWKMVDFRFSEQKAER